MLDAALEGLNVRGDGHYIDATFGRGGHAAAILDRLGPEGRLLAIDKDPEAIRVAERRFAADHRFAVEQGPFSRLETLAEKRGWLGKVDGILLDLGVSSPQLDDAGRGFSFRHEGPLDMRMDPGQGESAAQWLEHASEREIAEVLRNYGEERFSRRIARRIVAVRSQEGPIATTRRLAALIAECVPHREPGKDPATRSFQAIRIHINRELEELGELLPQTLRVLAPGGRLVVISFHSLEDRLVKRFIRAFSGRRRMGRTLCLQAVGGAIRPTEAELRKNPRARSAVLRVAERCAAGC